MMRIYKLFPVLLLTIISYVTKAQDFVSTDTSYVTGIVRIINSETVQYQQTKKHKPIILNLNEIQEFSSEKREYMVLTINGKKTLRRILLRGDYQLLEDHKDYFIVSSSDTVSVAKENRNKVFSELSGKESDIDYNSSSIKAAVHILNQGNTTKSNSNIPEESKVTINQMQHRAFSLALSSGIVTGKLSSFNNTFSSSGNSVGVLLAYHLPFYKTKYLNFITAIGLNSASLDSNESTEEYASHKFWSKEILFGLEWNRNNQKAVSIDYGVTPKLTFISLQNPSSLMKYDVTDSVITITEEFLESSELTMLGLDLFAGIDTKLSSDLSLDISIHYNFNTMGRAKSYNFGYSYYGLSAGLRIK